MRPLSYYMKKTREVYLDDGAAGLLAAAARFGIGSVDLLYLRNVARRKIALRNVQGSKMFLFVNDPAICRELIVRGCHEKLSTRAISKELSPGMHVVDIGANIGYIIYVVILCLILYFGTKSLYLGQYDKKYYKEAQDTIISYTHAQKN